MKKTCECLNYREFGLEGDLGWVPHKWYLLGQSFLTRLKFAWRKLGMVALSNWKKNVSVCRWHELANVLYLFNIPKSKCSKMCEQEENAEKWVYCRQDTQDEYQRTINSFSLSDHNENARLFAGNILQVYHLFCKKKDFFLLFLKRQHNAWILYKMWLRRRGYWRCYCMWYFLFPLVNS